MPTITPAGGTVFSFLAVLEYSVRRDTGTIVQDRVSSNQPSPDITLRTASLRSGSLLLLFSNASTAQAAFDTLAGGIVFTFTHEDRPQWTMTAVPGPGDLELTIQEDAEFFVVRLPFQEITA